MASRSNLDTECRVIAPVRQGRRSSFEGDDAAAVKIEIVCGKTLINHAPQSMDVRIGDGARVDS